MIEMIALNGESPLGWYGCCFSLSRLYFLVPSLDFTSTIGSIILAKLALASISSNLVMWVLIFKTEQNLPLLLDHTPRGCEGVPEMLYCEVFQLAPGASSSLGMRNMRSSCVSREIKSETLTW